MATSDPLPLANLLLAFLPVALLLGVMHSWRVEALQGLWATLRMLVQLLAVGYVLTWVFETESALVVAAVIALMLTMAAWIAIRPLRASGVSVYAPMLCALGVAGLAVLALVTQLVLAPGRWFEPDLVIPIAGMIFANAMNTASLAAERFETERIAGTARQQARRDALEVALIPQINSLLAVGLVALPGMMTGQILSGVDPLVAARYQIVVMCMIFGSGGLAAVLYLLLAEGTTRHADE